MDEFSEKRFTRCKTVGEKSSFYSPQKREARIENQAESMGHLEEENVGEESHRDLIEFIEKHERALMTIEDMRSKMIQMQEKNDGLQKENGSLRNKSQGPGKIEPGEAEDLLAQVQSKHKKFRGVFGGINGALPVGADPIQLLVYIGKLQDLVLGQQDQKSPSKRQTEAASPKKRQFS